MKKHLFVSLLLTLSLVGLGACSKIGVSHGTNNCPPNARNVELTASLVRPALITPDGVSRPSVKLVTEGKIHFEAWSPEPGFTGLTIAPPPGSGRRAPDQIPPGQGPGAGATIDVTLPWTGTACWGREHPAGLLMQVSIYSTSNLQTLDSVDCSMDETSLPSNTGFVTEDSVPYDITDFIPGAKDVIAHCVGLYTPDDWTGDPVQGGPPHP